MVSLLLSEKLSCLVKSKLPLRLLLLFLLFSTSIVDYLFCIPLTISIPIPVPIKSRPSNEAANISSTNGKTFISNELKFRGYCGNARFDLIVDDDRNNYLSNGNGNGKGKGFENFTRIKNKNYFPNRRQDFNVPISFRKQELKYDKVSRSNEMISRFAIEPVIVRLNVVYDSALADEYKNDSDGLERFIRNLIFSTQLVYEQPEMSSVIKFNFVVVNIQKLSIDIAKDETLLILDKFRASSDAWPRDRADLNILLLFRNMWASGTMNKQLGLANVGIFCNSATEGALLLHANSVGSSLTLAHELAHNFNCEHDGQGKIEFFCDKNSNIMSPSNGANKLTWSPCSVSAIHSFFGHPKISACIYDQRRIASSRPFKPMFDLTNDPNNPNRKVLPGEDKSIDMQCSEALDRTATSALTTKNRNHHRYTTCQDLYCVLGGVFSISIGPAPSGSICDKNGSKCYNAVCGLKPS